MIKKNLLLLVIISAYSINAYSQNEKVFVTDKISDKYAYVDVVKTYERVAAKGYKSVDLFQKLGNSCYSNLEYSKAANWYCELFALTSDLEPEYYHRYSHSLRFIGQFDTADELLKKLQNKSKAVASIENK